MEPQHYFSFRWHPHAIEAGHDYSKEPTTLVEFTLNEVDNGTRLTIVESGFEALPESRRAKAFTGVERGWEQQTHRIAKYLQTHR
ncbi:MAG: SRPBCC domain-containing protein [Gemmatimonadaceae bacterium]|nr:SRPBCC domain-containing protein [Gemmatimonadaceae bacterium]